MSMLSSMSLPGPDRMPSREQRLLSGGADLVDADMEHAQEVTLSGAFGENVHETGKPSPNKSRIYSEEELNARNDVTSKIAALAQRQSLSSPQLPPVEKHSEDRVVEREPCCNPRSMINLLSEAIRGPKWEGPTIIFDWDDTLFPTTYVQRQVWPSLSMSGSIPELTQDSRYYPQMVDHGNLVRFVLRQARKLARVAIVTLSKQPWVPFSTRLCLPGLDIKHLLWELDIPVYYCRDEYDSLCKNLAEKVEHWQVNISPSGDNNRIGLKLSMLEDGACEVLAVAEHGLVHAWNEANPLAVVQRGDVILDVNGDRQRLAHEFKNSLRLGKTATLRMARQTSGWNPSTEAKRIDLDKYLHKIYRRDKNASWNVLSVGDSPNEHEALKKVLAAKREPHCCKTVKLLEHPTLEQLNNELRLLMAWLPRLVQDNKNFDLKMDSLGDLEQGLLS